MKGNAKLNMAFVANLFNHYPALEPMEDMEYEDVEETREEKSEYPAPTLTIHIKPFDRTTQHTR